jgi:cellulose synthase/poly-beta-1,6-N-acetylglucosamine synthase-like glycosyltransferase
VSNDVFLTVCIPVYNSDVTEIVDQLFNQTSKLSKSVEIIIIDDHSEEQSRKKLHLISDKSRVIELEQNIGRSRIRNLFLDFAEGNYLLFIDGDSKLISSDFLSDYILHLEKNNSEVLLGGSIYQKTKPEKNKLLRWRYSTERESKSAKDRKDGKHAFKTNNFIVRKTIFEEVKFDESLIGYGHEDTLFGIELNRRKINIEHIDNPVLNEHLDANEVFLKKTENAIQNLVQIYRKSAEIPEVKQVKLIRYYELCKRWKLLFVTRLSFKTTQILFFNLLKSGYFTLWMFDFYKWGLFIRKIKS